MNKIRILHLEDNIDDSELILSAIEMGGFQVDYTRVDKEKLFLEQLKNGHFDLVLADYHLPTFNGAAALEICSDLYSETPFIIISGTLGEEIAVEMLKHGASDYLLKQNLKRLVPAIEHALAQAKLKQEKRKAENDLRLSEEKYRRIFENVQDVFFQIDSEGSIIEISPSICRMNGCIQRQLVGKNFVMFYDDADEFHQMLALVKDKDEIWDFEARFKNKNGNVKFVSINAHSLFNPDNEFIGIEGSIRDIDARKRMENELIKAKQHAEESDRLKSAFLANISHEIRTPMNGIIGFASLLQEADLNGEQRQKYLHIIGESGSRMLNLINQLVDISKIESGQMTVSISHVNVNEQMKTLLNFFQPEAKRKKLKLLFETKYHEKIVIVQTDADKVYAVLTNLINNAIKFTEKGEVKFGFKVREKSIEFYVIDTGRGIKEEKQKYIFDRFVQADQSYSRAYEGVGLGLSIAKEYADMLRGKLSVDSTEGKGSTFYFSLPTDLVLM